MSSTIRPGSLFLLLLLSLDLAFISLHLVHTFTPLLHHTFWSIEQDRGAAEVLQYAKAFWLIVMLGCLFKASKQVIYLGWLCFFSLILADDAFQLHERTGLIVAKVFKLEPMLGLRNNDFGEILFYCLLAVVLLLCMGITYVKSSIRAKYHTQDLLLLIICLAFFGGFVDLLHSVLGQEAVLIGMLEDGGEMVVMSFITSYLFWQLVDGEALYLQPFWQFLFSKMHERVLSQNAIT